MFVKPAYISGLSVITPRCSGRETNDEVASYDRDALAAGGVFVSFSWEGSWFFFVEGTVRGLHFQAPPRAQAKLVRCGRGVLFDVAVDIRRGSPSYGRWFGVELSFDNGKQLLIPAGFAHGFVTRAPETEIIYKCSDYYAPEMEGALAWNDPDIGIDWGLGEAVPILSAKDAAAPAFAGFDSPFVYDGGAS